MMKKNISKGEKWLRRCLSVVVVTGMYWGSFAEAGTVVNIEDNDTINENLIGGKTEFSNSDASDNEVTIGKNVNFIADSFGQLPSVYGGHSSVISGMSSATNNVIDINSGNINEIVGGYAYGYDIIKADNNIVTVKDVEAEAVCGGYSYAYNMSSTPNAIVSSNTVNLNGNNKINDLISGGEVILGNGPATGKSENNTVIVNDGEYVGIAGGSALQNNSGYAGSNIGLSNNTVIVNGGKITGGVVGSIIRNEYDSVVGESYAAKNNTVIWTGGDIDGMIGGEARFTLLPGGLLDNCNNIGWNETTKSYTGVTWDSKSTSNSSFHFYASAEHSNKNIWGIGHFKHYNFYIDKTVPAGSTLINVNNIIDGKVVPIDLRGSTIGVAVSSDSTLNNGDSITLLATKELLTDSNLTNNKDFMLNGSSRAYGENIYDVYDFTLANDGCNLNATVGNRSSNPKSEDVPASRQPEVALIDDKLDIVDTAYHMSIGKSEPVIYYDFNYTDVKKGDLTLRGSDNVIGSATTKGDKEKKNTITQGPFIEYGNGSFGGKNFYSNGGVEGSGKNKKYGAGYLFRQVKFGKHHFDAYVRAGKINNEFRSFMQGVGNVDYDNSDVYYAAHFGYGQYTPIDPHTTMDVYGKYFYKIIPGSSTTTHVNGGTDINTEFDALTSHKFRIGSKITWDYMEEKKKMMFADLALEHELSHTQTTTLGDRVISNSSGADTTAVMEIGYRQVFGPKDAFLFTADLQGYAGTRTGFGGNIGVRFNF